MGGRHRSRGAKKNKKYKIPRDESKVDKTIDCPYYASGRCKWSEAMCYRRHSKPDETAAKQDVAMDESALDAKDRPFVKDFVSFTLENFVDSVEGAEKIKDLVPVKVSDAQLVKNVAIFCMEWENNDGNHHWIVNSVMKELFPQQLITFYQSISSFK